MKLKPIKTETLEKIFKICILIVMLSIIFDISVTYTFYKKDTNFFLNHEGNRNLVGELKEGISFFNTLTVEFTLISPFILFCLLNYIKNYFKKIYGFSLVIFIVSLMLGSIIHIVGGLSWLI